MPLINPKESSAVLTASYSHGLKELPKQQWVLIVKKYPSEGYKIISKTLDIPWNIVKRVIIKWRKYDITVTIAKTVCLSKILEMTRSKHVREAVETYSNIKRATGISSKY